jgi:acetyl-CoA carboxylase biotin carboxyl carrier protein
MKAKEIQDLIDFISNSGLAEVKIETQEFKLSIKKHQDAPVVKYENAPLPISAPIASAQSAPANTSANSPAPAASAPKEDDSKYLTIKSPMIGTFYRAANPESANFANVGDTIKAGDTVCIIEAMKLFNEIESEISGRIVKLLVENATPVEYDQPLFLVDPAG